ncbi:MAG: substrate-binding domain-containing protein [Christensenellaceae bacterium]
MKLQKKTICYLLICLCLFSACASKPFDKTAKVTIVSREDGSGTRSAFVDLFDIKAMDENGESYDNTTINANITNSTSVVMTTIAGDPHALGYISLGSLHDMIKPLAINDVLPSVESIRDGSYVVSRPFLITTKSEVSPVTIDFIAFINSKDGQQIIEDNDYVSAHPDAEGFSSQKPTGKIVIAGSSSVTPVMEKLKEAYLVINPNATIELQQSDSTTGMQAVIDGIADIGMASRALKESEESAGLVPYTIALDGIVVIANHKNPLVSLSQEEVKDLFSGKTIYWNQIIA